MPCMMRDKPVRTRHHRQWDQYVYRITGGLTILRPAIGKWVSPSTELVEERVIPVRIACTEEQIEKIIQFTLQHYDQEAVLYYKVTPEVYIIHRKENQ